MRGVGGDSLNVKAVEMLLESLGEHEEVFKDIESEKSNSDVLPAALYSGFNLSIWIEQWGRARNKMEEGIARLELITGSIPRQGRKLLAGQRPVEQLYYNDLKEAALFAVGKDYKAVAETLAAVNSAIIARQISRFRFIQILLL